MVDVLEELELDRVAEPLGRLQPVEDDAAAPAGEVLVEEPHGAAEDPRQVRSSTRATARPRGRPRVTRRPPRSIGWK